MNTIAHIGPANLPLTYSKGGAIERRIMELGRAQARSGHRVIVYSADQNTATIYMDGMEVRQIACRLPESVRTLELTNAALRQLQSEPVDVLHFHSVPEGAFLAHKIRAQKLLSYDDFRFRRGRSTPLFRLYRRMLARFDQLLPVSEYCLRESTTYWELDQQRAHVLYNGVNLKQFAPDNHAAQALRASLGIGDSPVVFYAGRVCHQKGTDVLLDAWSLLRQEETARLIICGPPLQFGNAGDTDLTRRISTVGGLYLGAVDDALLPDLMNLCDVFVLPTRRDEMFGMAALEAQACGKPVVCSRHGGLPEVVSERSGMFFQTGDPIALAACLKRLLRDRDWHAQLVSNARSNAERFSWDKLAAELESLYGTQERRILMSRTH